MEFSYNWDDVYPELVNKMRWAICTSFKTRASNYPYGAAQNLATVLSQQAIEIVKMEQTEPGVVGTTSTIRGFYHQQSADVSLDKVK